MPIAAAKPHMHRYLICTSNIGTFVFRFDMMHKLAIVNDCTQIQIQTCVIIKHFNSPTSYSDS